MNGGLPVGQPASQPPGLLLRVAGAKMATSPACVCPLRHCRPGLLWLGWGLGASCLFGQPFSISTKDKGGEQLGKFKFGG